MLGFLGRGARLGVLALLIGAGTAWAQDPPPVVDLPSWQAAIAQANANGSSPTTITIAAPQVIVETSVFLNANVTILGQGNKIVSGVPVQYAERLLFIAGGNVNIQDLWISGYGTAGGQGNQGGGGGAGLGGAIFIGSGTYASGDGSAPVQALSAPDVTLTNVIFSYNTATSGPGLFTSGLGLAGGGGGGLGGDGAIPAQSSHPGGGGGGGIIGGVYHSASGGYGYTVPEPGLFGLDASGGAGGPGVGDGQPGASGAGGGGGGASGETAVASGGGGGGGVNGGRGYYQNDDYPNGGGAGGFGGGGGGSTGYYGGVGGYGGGGGGGVWSGGDGGFGGGGGAGGSLQASGAGGFGAGDGGIFGQGGGYGLGAGGAVFVMDGASLTINVTPTGSTAFIGNSAVSAGNGSAYGNDLFLGGNVMLNIASGQTLSLDSVGGAGNTSDPNVSSAPADQIAMVQGGITLDGGGGLVLTGVSTYSGATVVNTGTLSLAAGAQEIGTSGITIGQNAQDNASLVLGSGSTLQTNGAIMLAEVADSTGSMTIGSGAGSQGAKVIASAVTGGAGTATLTFQQNYAADSQATTYQFQSLITGSLDVIQDGPGTTQLTQSNTYTGKTIVNQGTLLVSATDGLGNSKVYINEGTVSVAAGAVISNEVEITGGGILEVALHGGEDFSLVPAAKSNLGNDQNTTVELLEGEAALPTTLQISFSTTTEAPNDWMRLSDICSIEGVNNLYVVQLTMENVGQGAYLGWYDPSMNLWYNAVDGTSYNVPITYVDGAFNPETDLFLGYYGFDESTGSAWAVVDQQGDFAIIPEPSIGTLLLMALGGAMVMAFRRRAGEQGMPRGSGQPARGDGMQLAPIPGESCKRQAS